MQPKKYSQKLADINREIIDRKAYLREQEELITKTIADGNLKLISLKYEVEEEANTLMDVKAELVAATKHKADVEAMITEAEDQLRVIKQIYATMIQKTRDNIIF